jgi:hypothetical protein
VSVWLSCPRAIFSPLLYPFFVFFLHMYDRAVAVRTLPRWFTLLGGRLYGQRAVPMTLGTMHEAASR